MSGNNWLASLAEEHCQALRACAMEQAEVIDTLAARLATILRAGGRLLVCGNGGSACDAMHIAGEFVGRFTRERQGLAAIALSADSGILTAVGNDYGFDRVFARQVEAYGHAGDMLIGLSTSGKSPNVLAALATARTRGLNTVLLTGQRGAQLQDLADYLIAVPSEITARIQETHIFLLHALADRVEATIAEATP
jgi:D-sedoheptulose 7-phosphate isomerase